MADQQRGDTAGALAENHKIQILPPASNIQTQPASPSNEVTLPPPPPSQVELSQEAEVSLQRASNTFNDILTTQVTEERVINGKTVKVTLPGDPWKLPQEVNQNIAAYNSDLTSSRTNYRMAFEAKSPEEREYFLSQSSGYNNRAIHRANLFMGTGRMDPLIEKTIRESFELGSLDSNAAINIDGATGAHPSNLFFPRNKQEFDAARELIFGPNGIIERRIRQNNEVINYCQNMVETKYKITDQDDIRQLRLKGFDVNNPEVLRIMQKYGMTYQNETVQVDEAKLRGLESYLFVKYFFEDEVRNLHNLQASYTKEKIERAWAQNLERLKKAEEIFGEIEDQGNFEQFMENMRNVFGTFIVGADAGSRIEQRTRRR